MDSEALDQLPSSWCRTGFLVPTETDLSLKCDDDAQTWQRTPRQEALALSHSEISATRGLTGPPVSAKQSASG